MPQPTKCADATLPVHAKFAELFSMRRRTAAEEKLKNLLGGLIQDYDGRNALPPDDSWQLRCSSSCWNSPARSRPT